MSYSKRAISKQVKGRCFVNAFLFLICFSIPSAFFGAANAEYLKSDLNGDGVVNFSDYVLFAKDYGRTDGTPYDPESLGKTDTVTVVLRDTVEVAISPFPPPAITVVPSAGISPSPELYARLGEIRDTLCEHLDYPSDSNMLVEFSENIGPLVYHERSPGGEYRINLHRGGIYYGGGGKLVLHGLILQFAHEYGHILSNYRDEGPYGQQKWFDEAISHIASIFAMVSFSEKYVQDYLENPSEEKERLLSQVQVAKFEGGFMLQRGQKGLKGGTLRDWYGTNKYALENENVKSPASRNRQEVVAAALFGMFRKDPASAWNAVRYMNRGPKKRNTDFKQYLTEWYKRTPPRYQHIVVEIMGRFGF